METYEFIWLAWVLPSLITMLILLNIQRFTRNSRVGEDMGIVISFSIMWPALLLVGGLIAIVEALKLFRFPKFLLKELRLPKRKTKDEDGKWV
ncbi:hypothetical protein DRQ25_12125 [Candidatus Fermentibacteria bacterium]|nr:MAG: hypothetical protein DRQ25_12125 [Candidatus Fermentibacteria bacterium]